MSNSRSRSEVPRKGVEEVAIDDLLEVLSNPACRRILYHLRECETATLDELARVVTDSDAEPTERSTVALRTDYVPKMDDLGIVSYDPAWEYVRFPDDPALRQWVDLVRQGELSQRRQ